MVFNRFFLLLCVNFEFLAGWRLLYPSRLNNMLVNSVIYSDFFIFSTSIFNFLIINCDKFNYNIRTFTVEPDNLQKNHRCNPIQ